MSFSNVQLRLDTASVVIHEPLLLKDKRKYPVEGANNLLNEALFAAIFLWSTTAVGSFDSPLLLLLLLLLPPPPTPAFSLMFVTKSTWNGKSNEQSKLMDKTELAVYALMGTTTCVPLDTLTDQPSILRVD